MSHVAALSHARNWISACLMAVTLGGCIQTGEASLQNGVVLAATPANQPGDNTGAGAIAGMVMLGAAGGAVGAGAGKALAVAGGVIVGAMVGSAAEAAAQTHDGVAYTIQLGDGRVVTLIQHLYPGDAVFGVGALVTLETSGSAQRIVARQS